MGKFTEALLREQKMSYEVAKRKNKDYNDSWAKQGLVGVLTRLSDKLERALNISDDGHTVQVVDEKLEDTLVDLSNYSLMALMIMHGYRPDEDYK